MGPGQPPVGLMLVVVGFVISSIGSVVLRINPRFNGDCTLGFCAGTGITLLGMLFVFGTDGLTASRGWLSRALLVTTADLVLTSAVYLPGLRSWADGDVWLVLHYAKILVRIAGLFCFLMYLRHLANFVPDEDTRKHVHSGTFWMILELAKGLFLFSLSMLALALPEGNSASEFLLKIRVTGTWELLKLADARLLVLGAKLFVIASPVCFFASLVSYTRLLLKLIAGLHLIDQQRMIEEYRKQAEGRTDGPPSERPRSA